VSDEKRFEVTVFYSGCTTYIVAADDGDHAKEIAEGRWMAGDQGDNPVSDKETAIDIKTTEF
jgi:hypothetical protein